MLPGDFGLAVLVIVIGGFVALALIFEPLITNRTVPRAAFWSIYSVTGLMVGWAVIEVSGLGCLLGI